MADTPASATITVYSRPGCHLCDELVAELLPICETAGACVRLVDIGTSLALERDYGLVIPVVEFAGRELCRVRLDANAVRQALAGH